MPVTSPDSIYYVDTSTADSIATITAAQATSIQAALTDRLTGKRQMQTYKWANATARGAQTGMTEGDIGDQADTEQRWRYNGTAWANITIGLFPIIPTSVSGTGVTLGAAGKITLAGAAAVTVNGVFSSAYDNYLIQWDTPTHPNVDTTLQLRVGGTTAVLAGSYGTQRTWGNTTVTTTVNNGAASTFWSVDTASAGATLGASGEITLFGPALPSATRGLERWQNASSVTAMWMGSGSLYHSVATAYDGFVFTSSGMTGAIRVFGYNSL